MTDNTSTIVDALDRQVRQYETLEKLAQQQHEHVRQSRTEELLDVLAKRQEVLLSLAELEGIIAPVKAQWTQFLSQLDDTRRALAEGHMARTRQLLERITSADREDALVLQQRKLNLGKQISQTRSAAQVNRQYAASAYGRSGGSVNLQR